MNGIADLDFGRESAESEQKFLTKVLLPTPVFERIRGGHKQLVLGRKGAGKTAVCLTVYENLQQQALDVSLITPRDLSKFKISLLEKGSLNTAESSLLAWKYVFLTELGEYALQTAEEKYGGNYLTWPEHFKRIRSFMADNSARHATWMDRTFKVVRSIKRIGVIHIEAELEARSAEREIQEFADRLDEIPEVITEALDSLNRPIYILVDQVDELWDPSKESQALVVGLLRAAKEIHEQISSVHVITFLRSDIFDALQFHDSDKFHSSEERIVWAKNDLQSLIALRARTSTQISGKRGATDRIWELFFPATVDDKDSFEYLLQYTLMRPRDLIQLCNLCKDKAQNHRHTKIEASDIIEALPQYSKWKLRDLRDEYAVQYPFLERVFLGVFQYSSARLTKDEISELFSPLKEQLLKEFDRYYFEPISNLLQILYYTGFLGAVKDGRVLYSSAGDDVVISSVGAFEIHPAFRLALDVRKPRAETIRKPKSVSTESVDAKADVGSRDSNIQIGGVANVSIVFGRAEREIGTILSRFGGQQAPGSIFNLDGTIELPAFRDIHPQFYIPESDVRLDFLAVGPQSWAIEVKYRTLQTSDLHEVASHAMAAGAKAWIVSHSPIPDQTRVIAKNLGIMITGPQELRTLSELVRV